MRFVLTLPQGDALVNGGVAGGPHVAISPDGKYVAYVATRGTTQQIFLRAMDNSEPIAMAGTEGGGDPFFSPDSRWLGFVAAGSLYKVQVSGGAVLRLASNVGYAESSWSDTGTIAFAQLSGSSLQQVPDSGGTAQSLTHLQQGESIQRSPDILPNGRALLFTGGRSEWSHGGRALDFDR